MLTGFRFMDFMSNRHDPGESMQRSARPNRGKGLRVKVNCYHKALHLECCRSPRYASGRRRCQLNVKLEIQIDIYKVDCFRFKNCRFVQVRIFQLLLTIVAVGKLVYNWKYNLQLEVIPHTFNNYLNNFLSLRTFVNQLIIFESGLTQTFRLLIWL